MAPWNDLTPFFRDFGQPVVFGDLDGGTHTGRGILDREALEWSTEYGGRVRTHRITLLLATAGLPQLAKGWGVTVDGNEYSVLDVVDNGEGTTTLYLEEP